MQCPGRAPQRSCPPKSVTGREAAENHRSAGLLQTPRFPSPPPPPPPACPGRDPPVGLAHLNLDLPEGTEAASPERAFSRAQATVEWGERARRELQQVSLAQTSVPCPGTAVICAPHRTLLSSSPPSRPALAVPAHSEPSAGCGAEPGGTYTPPRLLHPLQPACG